MKRRGTLISILFGICIVVFAGSVCGIGWTLWKSKRENDTFAKLSVMAQEEETLENAQTPAPNDESSESTVGKQIKTESRQYEKLSRLNPDFAGWLKIEGTKIDYPVMSTPDDPQYYIRRDFYGKDTVSGTPFLSKNSRADSKSILIYGHNMKNDTMFGTLDEYASQAYRNEHPSIEFSTPEETRSYEVFAAFRTRLPYDTEDGFRYYLYDGNPDEEAFHDFINQVSKAAYYNTGVMPEYGDELLILSTCSYHTENGRFVVVGCRKK